MSGWRNQLNAVGSNAFDFVQRISSELTAETEEGSNTDGHPPKDKSSRLERELRRYEGLLAEKDKEIGRLNESLRDASEEVEMTRQTLLDRLAAKDQQLEKINHEIDRLRDFQTVDDDNELSVELDVIRAEKTALSEELDRVSHELEQMRLQRHQEPIVKEDEELNKLKSELAKSNERIETLRNEMSLLFEKNQTLVQECMEKQEVSKELEQKLTTIQNNTVAQYSKQVGELQKKVDELCEENIQLRENLRTEREELVKADEANNQNSEAELNRISAELEAVQKALNTVMGENTALAAARDAVENESKNIVDLKDAELSELRAQLQSKDEESAQFSWQPDAEKDKEITALKESVEKLKVELNNSAVEIRLLNAALEAVKEEQAEAQRQKEEAEGSASDKLQRVAEELESTKRELKNANAEKSELTASRDALKEELEKVIESKESELVELHSQLEANKKSASNAEDTEARENELLELNNSLENLRTELTNSVTENRLLSAALESSKADLQRILGANEQHQAQVAQLESKISELQNENLGLCAEKNALSENFSSEMDETIKRMTDLRANFEESENTILSLEETISQLHSNNHRVGEELIKIQQGRNELLEQNQRMESEIQRFKVRIEELEGVNDELTAAMTERASNPQVDQRVFEEQQTKVQQLIAEIQRLNQERNSLTDQLDEALAKCEMADEQLNTSKSLSEEQTNRLQMENSKLTNYIDELKRTAVLSDEAIELLKRDNQSLSDRIKSVENQYEQLMSERKNLVDGTTEAELYRRYTQEKIEKKEQELQGLQNLLQSKDDAVNESRMYTDSLIRDNEMLRSRLESFNVTVKDLQSTYVETQKQLKDCEKKYKTEVDQLRMDFMALQKEKDAAVNSLANTTERLEFSERRIENMEQEIKALEDASPTDSAGSSSATETSVSAASLSPLLRNFIVSTITCEQRAESMMLLANVLGCTEEEKKRIERSYKAQPSHTYGWGSIFAPRPQNGPQNAKELYEQFLSFLDRETSLNTPTAASVQPGEPFVLNNEGIEPKVVKGADQEELKRIID